MGTRSGEIRASGIAPRDGVRTEMTAHYTTDEVKAAVVSHREASDGSRYQIWWTIIE